MNDGSFDIQYLNVFDIKTNKYSKVKLDFIFDKIEDLVFEYEGETYVLKSNKTPMQRLLEKSMTDFGEECFPVLADKHPLYGVDPNYKLSREELESSLLEMLKADKWKNSIIYKDIFIKNNRTRVEALVRAFVTFVATIRVKEQKEFEDKKKRKDRVLVVDYLLRFKEVIEIYKKENKSFSWLFTSFNEVVNDFNQDDRLKVVAYSLNALAGMFFKFINDNKEETVELNKTDTVRDSNHIEFYNKLDNTVDGMLKIIKDSIDNVKHKVEAIELRFNNSGETSKYVFFVKSVLKEHQGIINEYNRSLDKIKEAGIDKDAVYLAKKEFNERFKQYMDNMELWAFDVCLLNKPIDEQQQLILDAQYMNILYYFEYRNEKPNWIEAILTDVTKHIKLLKESLEKLSNV